MAGLLGNFKNPFGSGGLLSDPMVRLQMGAAMMGGQTLGQQIGGGLQAAGVAKQAQQEAAKRNQTVEWLKTINPELAQAVEMGALDAGDAYKMAVEKPKHPDFMAVDGAIFNPENQQWITGPGGGNKLTSDQQNYEYSIKQLQERGVPNDKLPTFQEWAKPKNNGISWRSPDGTEIQIGGSGDGGRNGTSIPAEVGARIGLGQAFLTEDYPEIIKMIDAGDATGPMDFAAGTLGKGNSGIVQRRMASGVDALRRGLTGAGMSMAETDEYAKRYSPQLFDSPETLRLKAEGLKQDLEAVSSGAINGKAGNISGLMPNVNAPSGAGGGLSIEELLQRY